MLILSHYHGHNINRDLRIIENKKLHKIKIKGPKIKDHKLEKSKDSIVEDRRFD